MYIGCFVGINHNIAATDTLSIRVISVQGSFTYTPDYI
jgi:hypothetical protein